MLKIGDPRRNLTNAIVSAVLRRLQAAFLAYDTVAASKAIDDLRPHMHSLSKAESAMVNGMADTLAQLRVLDMRPLAGDEVS